jgi:hypothetical protein
MLKLKKFYFGVIALLFIVGCGDSSSSGGSSSSGSSGGGYLDVMAVLDTDEANTHNGKNEAQVNHAIAVANQVFSNSGLDTTVRLVGVYKTKIFANNSENALDETLSNDGIKAKRNELKADLVVTFQEYKNDGYCGVAYANNNLQSQYAYSHVTLDCPATTAAHEMGHSLGLGHSQRQYQPGRTAYARGYGVDELFHTVMAYGSSYNTHNELFHYSTPDKSYKNHPTGNANTADATRSMKEALPHGKSYK